MKMNFKFLYSMYPVSNEHESNYQPTNTISFLSKIDISLQKQDTGRKRHNWMKIVLTDNTSLAVPGALAHHLQCHNLCNAAA